MSRIILINGSTGSGKSTISHKLGLKLGITRVISTDVVRQIFRSIVNSNLIDYMSVSSYEKLGSSRNLAYYQQRITLCEILDKMIERFIEENVDMIIEGVHIMPELYNKHKEKGRSIYLFTLYVKSISAHEKRFLTRQDESKKRIATKYLHGFDAIREIQDVIVKEANMNSNFLIDNDEMEDTLNILMNEICKHDFEKTHRFTSCL